MNGQSASYIGQEKFDEAEAALQEAVEKDPNNVDTLINLIVLAQQTGKSTEVKTLRTVNYTGFFMHDAPGKTALLKLNYCKKVFFSSSIYLPETFK